MTGRGSEPPLNMANTRRDVTQPLVAAFSALQVHEASRVRIVRVKLMFTVYTQRANGKM
ncbi:hypothetical protein J6590_026760 [Homalodisca vitripennis]|nr:hypothetical protein J6590_026760 [Homalodisca vitripennis]